MGMDENGSGEGLALRGSDSRRGCSAPLLLFAAVAFLATYIPARRAASIDLTVAFRCE
jgi:hypothetical protein